MHVVRDGQQELKFDGSLLATSSSGGEGRTRWVEFDLYRTRGGQYILSRVGRSLHYHSAECAVVRRNKIKAGTASDLDSSATPCAQCSPVLTGDPHQEVYPEQARYWAQVSSTADGVIGSLYKWDDSGARYLTNVARRLLTDAAARDEAIRTEFYTEYID